MSSNSTTNDASPITMPSQPHESTTTTDTTMTALSNENDARDLTKLSQQSQIPMTEMHRIAFAAELDLESLLKSWDSIALTSVLNGLLAEDFPLHIVMKYQLGRLIKSINKKAQKGDNKPIVEVSEKIMSKWQKLLPSGGQTPSTSPTPSPSPSPLSSPKETELLTFKQTTPPPSSQTTQPDAKPAPIPFRLAIQKDPPPGKPKAITNTSFFEKLKSPSSISTTVRPNFSSQRGPTHVSFTDMLNKIQQNKHTAVPSPVSSPTSVSSSSPLASPTISTVKKRPFETATTTPEKMIRKTKSKRVRFKPDHQLATYRTYEKDPEEWNFDETTGGMEHLGIMHVDQARSLDISEGQVLSQAHHPHLQQNVRTGSNDPRLAQLQNTWYPPRAVLVPDSCKLPWPKQSPEAAIQQERERVTLAAVYISLSHVPPTPTESDEPTMSNDYPPVIPLHDGNTTEIYVPPQPQQPQPQTPSYESKFSLSPTALPNQPVHLLHPYQPPQHVQYTPPTPQYTPSVPQHQIQSTTGNMYQPPQPVPSQPPQNSSDQLNILMNSGLLGAISEMVRNLNPQNGSAQPPPQSFPQLQQPAPFTSMSAQSSPQYIPSPTQFSHQYPLISNQPPTTEPQPIQLSRKQMKNQRRLQKEQKKRPQPPFQQQKKFKKKKAARDARFDKPCKFYNTSTGCLSGESCPFQHIDEFPQYIDEVPQHTDEFPFHQHG